jgi:hypothetical protein
MARKRWSKLAARRAPPSASPYPAHDEAQNLIYDACEAASAKRRIVLAG